MTSVSLMAVLEELVLPISYPIALVLAGSLFTISVVIPAAAQDINGFNREHTRIRSTDGRPCLVFRMESRPEIVMTNTYDHIVHVKNSCPQRINVTVCYQGARSNCRNLKLSAHGEGTTFLGSVYNQPNFTFDYDEKEDN